MHNETLDARRARLKQELLEYGKRITPPQVTLKVGDIVRYKGSRWKVACVSSTDVRVILTRWYSLSLVFALESELELIKRKK